MDATVIITLIAGSAATGVLVSSIMAIISDALKAGRERKKFLMSIAVSMAARQRQIEIRNKEKILMPEVHYVKSYIEQLLNIDKKCELTPEFCHSLEKSIIDYNKKRAKLFKSNPRARSIAPVQKMYADQKAHDERRMKK